MKLGILASGVLEFSVGGRITTPLANELSRRTEATNHFAVGDLVVFHDWSQVRGYESAARVHLTKWLWSKRSHFRAVHILTDDRLVSMGVNVANAALGGLITVHSEAESYAAAQRAAV